MRRQKVLPELSALNFEARERHITYGQLMAQTTPEDRGKIIEKWRKYYAAARKAEAESKYQEREAEKRRFMELYEQGLSDADIAVKCGCSAGKVRYWRNKRGLDVNRSNKVDK